MKALETNNIWTKALELCIREWCPAITEFSGHLCKSVFIGT